MRDCPDSMAMILARLSRVERENRTLRLVFLLLAGGAVAMVLMAQSSALPAVVQGRSIVVRDRDGIARIVLDADSSDRKGASIALCDRHGERRLVLSSWSGDAQGDDKIEFLDAFGRALLSARVRRLVSGAEPTVTISNQEGSATFAMSADSRSTCLRLRSEDKSAEVRADREGASISLAVADGRAASIGVTKDRAAVRLAGWRRIYATALPFEAGAGPSVAVRDASIELSVPLHQNDPRGLVFRLFNPATEETWCVPGYCGP